jgi:hypothetical protein
MNHRMNLEVVESLSEVRGRLVIGPTKTGRPRTIGLPAFLADMLGAHIGRYPSRDEFVFSAAEGGPSDTATSTPAASNPPLHAPGSRPD